MLLHIALSGTSQLCWPVVHSSISDKRKFHIKDFSYKQCTSSLPLLQRNKQTHEVDGIWWYRVSACYVRKEGGNLCIVWTKNLGYIYQPPVGPENPTWENFREQKVIKWARNEVLVTWCDYLFDIGLQWVRTDTHKRVCWWSDCNHSFQRGMARDVHKETSYLTTIPEHDERVLPMLMINTNVRKIITEQPLWPWKWN